MCRVILVTMLSLRSLRSRIWGSVYYHVNLELFEALFILHRIDATYKIQHTKALDVLPGSRGRDLCLWVTRLRMPLSRCADL